PPRRSEDPLTPCVRVESMELPGSGHSFELVLAARYEMEPRTRHEVTNGARHQHFPRLCDGSDARPDADGDPRGLAVVQLAFADVDADTDVEVERANFRDDGLSGPDCARRPVERCEEAVPGSVALLAPEPREFASYDSVVSSEKVTPSAVAECTGTLGGPEEVGEHDRRQDALRDCWRLLTVKETFDLVGNVEGEVDLLVVLAGDTHCLGVGDTS